MPESWFWVHWLEEVEPDYPINGRLMEQYKWLRDKMGKLRKHILIDEHHKLWLVLTYLANETDELAHAMAKFRTGAGNAGARWDDRTHHAGRPASPRRAA